MYSVIVYSNGNISSREPPIRDSNCSNATRTWIPWKFFFFFQKIIWPVLTHQIRIDFGHIKPAKAILLCWGWSTTSMVLGVISSYRIINNSIEEYANWSIELLIYICLRRRGQWNEERNIWKRCYCSNIDETFGNLASSSSCRMKLWHLLYMCMNWQCSDRLEEKVS